MRFETERLIIRKPILDDAKQIFINYTQDRDVTKYLIWEAHRELKEAEEWIQHCINEWDENKNLPFIIWHKKDNQAIGMVHFNIKDTKSVFGYVLSKKYWSRGIMTEATRPIIESLFTRDTMFRIEAVHDLENPASGRVMEKLGMQLEGVVRKYSICPAISKVPRDCKLYSIVKG